MPIDDTLPTAAPPAPEEMTTYYIALLKKGPAWTVERTPENDRLQGQHLAHLFTLRASGKLVLMGPFTDDGNTRGMSIFKTASLEEARALGDADPAVRAGHLVLEYHPWKTFKGVLP